MSTTSPSARADEVVQCAQEQGYRSTRNLEMLVLTSVLLSSVKQRSVSQIEYQQENGNQANSECKLKEGQV